MSGQTFYSAIHGAEVGLVAGAAALVWSAAPELTREQVVGILMDTVTDGRLNCEAAVKRAIELHTVPK